MFFGFAIGGLRLHRVSIPAKSPRMGCKEPRGGVNKHTHPREARNGTETVIASGIETANASET